jgi:hypothetical protein
MREPQFASRENRAHAGDNMGLSFNAGGELRRKIAQP